MNKKILVTGASGFAGKSLSTYLTKKKFKLTKVIFRNLNKKGKIKIDLTKKINLKNIKAASSILKFVYFVYKTLKISNATYLLVCITPYTFFSFLILFLLLELTEL